MPMNALGGVEPCFLSFAEVLGLGPDRDFRFG